VALDRVAQADLGAADDALSRAARALSAEAPVQHHDPARARARRRARRRRRHRARKISRPLARRAVGRQGSRRHRGHRPAMARCWSLDKRGPMCRGVEDTALVLRALSGPDASDPSTTTMTPPPRLDFDGNAPVRGLRVGWFPKWMKDRPSTPVDTAALEHL